MRTCAGVDIMRTCARLIRRSRGATGRCSAASLGCFSSLSSTVVADAHRQLAPLARAFPVNAKDAKIRFLREPSEFYDTLLAAISRAKSRVTLSALYLGTNELEQRLVDRLDHTLTSRPEVTVRLLFDGSRALRKSRDSGASTVSLLLPLLHKHGPKRVVLHLCTMPAARSVANLPSPTGEIAGVCHVKAFVVDDEVIITGANLSTEYFRNRQDRYVHIGKSRAVAEWYHHLVESLGRCGDTVEACPPRGDAALDFTLIPPEHPTAEWRQVLEDLVRPVPGGELGASPVVGQPSEAALDTHIFPTVQCGPVGVEHDARVVRAVLESIPAAGVVRLATAYLNPPPELTTRLAAAAPLGEVSILTAHRDSHGFRSARGLLSYVVDCYHYIESRELRPALQAARGLPATQGQGKAPPPSTPQRPAQIRGYRREGWTYHAKGMWLASSPSTPCFLSIAGSSNFGRRSYERDLEAQMVILSEDADLCTALDEEWALLNTYAVATEAGIGSTNGATAPPHPAPSPRFAARYLSKLFAWLL